MNKLNIYFLAGQSNANPALGRSITKNLALRSIENNLVCQKNLGGQHSTMWTDENGVRGALWDSDIAEWNTCLENAISEGYDPVVRAFVWWQGERDALEIEGEAPVDSYEARLERYFNDMQEYFDATWFAHTREMVFVDMLIGANAQHRDYRDPLKQNIYNVRNAKRCVSARYINVINLDTQQYPRTRDGNLDFWHVKSTRLDDIGHDIVNTVEEYSCNS